MPSGVARPDDEMSRRYETSVRRSGQAPAGVWSRPAPSNGDALHACDLMHVLIAASGEIDQNGLTACERGGELHDMGNGMGRFEGRHDAFRLRQEIERRDRLIVGDGGIRNASTLLIERMLRSDGRVVESGRHGMRQLDLTI